MKLLRRFLAPLLALCFALTPAPAGAFPPARTAAVLSGVQGWSFQGSSADLNFALNAGSCTIARLLKPCGPLIPTTRASTGYVQWLDGHLTLVAANTPRLSDKGLLSEQAATNLQTHSQQFTVSPWAPGNGGGGAAAPTITDNQAVAPDGTTTAALVQFAVRTAAQYQYVNAPQALSTGTYTGSIYVEAADAPSVGSKIDIWQFDGAVKNLATVTLTTSWQRLATTGVSSLSAGGTNEADTFGRAASAGGGSTAATKIYVWAGQIETGSVASSYIPTTTVSVTRAADSIPLAGPALAAALASKSAYAQTNALNPNTTNSNGMIVYFASGGQQLRFGGSTVVAADNGVNAIASSTIGGSGTFAGRVKVAYGYDASSYTAIANGGTQGVTASPWGTLTGTVSIGNRSSDLGRPINGYLERLAFGAVKGQYDRMTIP